MLKSTFHILAQTNLSDDAKGLNFQSEICDMLCSAMKHAANKKTTEKPFVIFTQCVSKLQKLPLIRRKYNVQFISLGCTYMRKTILYSVKWLGKCGLTLNSENVEQPVIDEQFSEVFIWKLLAFY